MNTRILLLPLLALTLFLQGCFSEDAPIPATTSPLPVIDNEGEDTSVVVIGEDTLRSKPSPLLTSQVFIGEGPEYAKQVFFDLSSGQYQSRDKYDWDIRFPIDLRKNPISINSSKYAHIHYTTANTLSQLDQVDPSSAKYYDHASGEKARSAFGNWESGSSDGWSKVYVLFRGFKDVENLYPTADLYWKFRFRYALDQSSVQVQFSRMQPDALVQQVSLTLDASVNYGYLNIETASQVQDYEPSKSTWDLLFTRYVHEFEDQPVAFRFYLVSGTLLNPHKTRAVLYQGSKSFADLTLEDAHAATLSNDQAVIGYDWKEYVFENGGSWRVYPEMTYLLQDSEGYYYKLRFTGWLNEARKTGYPSFDYQRF